MTIRTASASALRPSRVPSEASVTHLTSLSRQLKVPADEKLQRAEGLSVGESHMTFSTETYLGFSPSIFNGHLWVNSKYVARRWWVAGVWPVIRGAHGWWLRGLRRIPASGSLLGEGCFSPCLCPSSLLTHAHVHPLSISLSLSLR